MPAYPLRRILIRFAALVALLPLGVTVLLGSLWLLPQAQHEIRAYHRQLAVSIAGQVDSYLRTSRASAASVAALAMQGTGRPSLQQLQQVIDANLHLLKHLKAIYLVNQQGRIVAVGLAGQETSRCNDLVGLDLSRNELVQQVRRSGTEQWSDTFLSVALAVPAGRETVIAEFELSNLSAHLQEATQASDQVIMVIDRHGQVIADQKGTWTAQQMNLSNIPLIRDRYLSAHGASGSFVLDGVTMVGSLHRISTVEWWVLVARPQHAAYRQLWTAAGILAAGLGVTTLAAFGVVIAVARRMSIRFESLAEHARQIAVHELPAAWPTSNVAEFNALAGSLQQMSEHLHERARLLEDEIAERQLAEQLLQVKHLQLEALNLTLEQRVQEELTKNREKDLLMIQQGRLAAMGEMMSNIAHQWRQPLNDLGIMIQMLRVDYDDGLLDQEQLDRSISDCMKVIQHMSQTIDTFRDFFKKDRSVQTFNVADAITAMAAMLRASLQAAGIRQQLDLEPDCFLVGLPNDFTQALLNLCNNARDILIARAVAEPVIVISSRSNGAALEITVEDNGGGVPPEILDRVFEPYFTTRHKAQGTGLGLYIVKKIIEESFHGSITVQNSLSGACFTITVPLQ